MCLLFLITDVNDCSGNNPCKNGGSCVNNHGGYTCRCRKGFTGTNCEKGTPFGPQMKKVLHDIYHDNSLEMSRDFIEKRKTSFNKESVISR